MALPIGSVVIVLAVALAIAIGWIVRLEVKVRKLLLGKDARTLEDSILFTRDELEKNAAWKQKIETYLAAVEKRLGKTLHEAKTVRFNAFKGTGDGGNQSFATAFLSEQGSGVVVSSLYTRDRVSVFAKPVEKNTSAFELTDEEREAISKTSASIADTKR